MSAGATGDPTLYKYDAGEIPPEHRLPTQMAPAYVDKQALKSAVQEHMKILLNLALNKTLHYWKKLIIDDELLEHLPLKALRAAADTRGVSSKGRRDEIIAAIEMSVLNEEEAIYLDEISRIELAERELEAMGSVYTFGNGDVGQLGLGGSRLIESSTPIVIPQLRAVGVRTVRGALDTDIFMGITDKQEVVVWGNGRGVPFFGLKPQEMVDLELLTPRDGKEFNQAVKKEKKRNKKKSKKKQGENKDGDDNNEDDDPPPPPPPDAEAESRMSTGELLAKKRAQQKSMALRGIATNRTVGQYGTHEARRLGFRSRSAEPILIDKFHDEHVIDVSIGRTHATAVTSNGDLYVWGLNGHYQCGLQNAQDRRGDPMMDSEEHKAIRIQNGSLRGFVATRAQAHTSYVVDPALNRQFKTNQAIASMSCWAQGTSVVLRDGRLLACGLASATAVRLPAMEHVRKTGYGGVLHKPNPQMEIFREPRALRTLGVRMVACGSNHCVCVTNQLGAMSWGNGSGGKLGHGNNEDVEEPKRIVTMMNDIVLHVACGIWHSVAVILVAPLFGNSGWVCTWGTGTKGQLGLGTHGEGEHPIMYTTIPKIIEEFRADITVQWVAVGPNHNVALTNTNELYSWGSNRAGMLGRPKKLGKHFPLNGYSDVPDVVEGFTGWGKGLPCGVACGPSATVVCLLPWDGPDEEQWTWEQEEEREQKRREKERRKREEEERKEAIRKQREHERIVALRRLEKYHPLCSICMNVAPYTNCFGFWPDVKRPMQCGSCGHERSQHRSERKKEELNVWTFDVIMQQEKKVTKVMEEAGVEMAKDVGELENNEGKMSESKKSKK